MTQLLNLKGDETVLEVGTGSGYQAAILAELCDSVCTIEIVPELAESAAKRLKKLGYDNVNVYCGDGYKGWHDKEVMFDAIIVTAAPPKVPRALLDQLKDGCNLVVPEGKGYQYLRIYLRKGDKFEKQNIIQVRFVPMIHGED
jgi:protein-L-isoaspartate(D-aspartate) O-methyltransferase